MLNSHVNIASVPLAERDPAMLLPPESRDNTVFHKCCMSCVLILIFPGQNECSLVAGPPHPRHFCVP